MRSTGTGTLDDVAKSSGDFVSGVAYLLNTIYELGQGTRRYLPESVSAVYKINYPMEQEHGRSIVRYMFLQVSVLHWFHCGRGICC